MKRYRIYFGLPAEVGLGMYTSYLSSFLDGFSVFHLDGYWHGTREDSILVEYIGTPEEGTQLHHAARYARTLFNQESVLFTVEDIQVQFITA